MSGRITLLVDNGSLEPAATRQLRKIARELAARIGEPVEPVSLLHSSAIPAAKLGGEAAEIFEPAVAARLKRGGERFVVVPLFFGPSRALTEYLPARIAHLAKSAPQLEVSVAPVIFQERDARLARILADQVRAAQGGKKIVVVDHGSPVPEVTAVRDQLARKVKAELGDGVEVAAASMERRPGAEYQFADPLLENLLELSGWNEGEVTIAMQFLLPGRHAGADGDVARICRQAEARNPGLRTKLTPLVGEHPLLVEILADRWQFALRAN